MPPYVGLELGLEYFIIEISLRQLNKIGLSRTNKLSGVVARKLSGFVVSFLSKEEA